MQFVENWDAVLKKAWSIKFTALSILASAAEVVVQMIQPAGIPNGMFASIAAGISVCAGVARLLAQQEVSGAAKSE
jgi:K+-transporting ATPase A subunit